MGLFGNKKKDNTEFNAFLGVGTEYRGKLDFVGTVRIDGQFEGEIFTDGDLILGRKAVITGSVIVGRLTSCGRIMGDVVVKERAVLEKTSVIEGTLNTPVLTVEKGAIIEGGITMTKAGAETVNTKVVKGDFGGDAAKPSELAEVAKTGSDNTTI